VSYRGRFGNHVFQYACARLFARERGLALASDFPGEHILPTTSPEPGETFDGPVIPVGDDDAVFDLPRASAKYRFDGFFQRPGWYFERRRELQDVFSPRPLLSVNSQDMLVNLRLGDYRTHRVVIHPEWYIGILEKASFRGLVIVTDEEDPEYLKHFARWRPTIIPGPPADHWHALRSFENVIASNSTFCWWAMFFGAVKKLYVFRRWIDNDKARLNEFPGAIQVGGRFLHEEHPEGADA